MNQHSVLFVCTANICRSPMAVALLRKRVKDSSQKWRIESAGTWAMPGEPAASKTQAVLQERGLQAANHRSRLVTRELLSEFNLVLTMEVGHKEALSIEFPELAGRVYVITEMVDQAHDIEDPFGKSLAAYEDTAVQLELILDQGLKKIRRLSKRVARGR